MHIEMWPIDRPVDYPKNARKWSQKAIDTVAASLREFGFRQPLVVDEHGVIIIGHLRRRAARDAGFTVVPVHVADLPAGKVRQLRLMDNRSHDEAQWDLDILAEEMAELSRLDLDLTLTGFDAIMWDLGGEGVKPEWSGGMPAYNVEDQTAWKKLIVHFRNEADFTDFQKRLGQTVDQRGYIWHPAQERNFKTEHYITPAGPETPRYPIYIVSKGRWESRLTANALDKMHVPYRIVVEPQERDSYAAVIDPAKILVLPFSNLGQGSIPARNWIWEHSISEGHARHWILDDNIQNFFRFHNNLKLHADTGAIFQAAEDFTDRYVNVAMSGFQYDYFAPHKTKHPPFILNTRIYSCILLDNSIPHRWRGRYNEDTDLSLRILKDGLCTILFYPFLAKKTMTMKMKGGNMDSLYKGNGRLKMAQSLHAQHPDVVTVKEKWGRWQHVVDYKPFKANKFIPKPGFKAPAETDDYGMVLVPFEQPAPAAPAELQAAKGTAEVLKTEPAVLLQQFLEECRAAGVEDVAAIHLIATQTMAHLKGSPADRSVTIQGEELQLRWYRALEGGGSPDWSVYAEDYYLGELWACWMIYSRKYLLEVSKPKSLPPSGVIATLGNVRRVVDLGCGIGITTAALTQMFPGAEVLATNLSGTRQAAVAAGFGRRYGFRLQETVQEISGPADVVFASEYFEHVQAPVAHLDEVIEALHPRGMLIANTFGQMAIGHFNTYQVNGHEVPGRDVSKLFNGRLRQHGYNKVPTKMWNQRPAYWLKG